LVALAALVWGLLWALRPPPPVGADASLLSFSAVRAAAELGPIASAPRPPGSAHHDVVRDRLRERLSALDCEVEIQATTWVEADPGDDADAPPPRAARLENVIARRPGRVAGAPAVMLMAHYDSVATGPGASDDGYGVAVILEIARALAAAPPLERDVIFLVTDAEELGLMGAAAFAKEHRLLASVGAVVNLEARGNAGPVLMFETAGPDRGLLAALARAPRPMGTSLARAIYQRMPNDTDFSVLRRAEVPGLNLANIDGVARYHAPTDTAAAASLATLQHHGDTALTIVRHLAATPAAEVLVPASEPSVYFDLAGRVLVAYDEGFALKLSFLAVGAIVAFVVVALRRRLLSPVGVGLAFGAQLFSIVGALLLAVVIYLALGAARPELFWPSARPDLTHAAVWGFAAIGLLAAAVAHAAFATRVSFAERGCAGLGLWLVLNALLHQSLPGGTYIATWPALIGGLLGLGAVVAPWRGLALALLGVGAVVPLVLLVPLGAHLADAFGAASGPAITLVAAVALVPQAPLLAALRSPWRWCLPVVAVAGLLVGLARAGTGPIFDETYPRPDTILAVASAEAGASWMTPDPEPAPWTRSRFATMTALSTLFPPWPERPPLHTGPARALGAALGPIPAGLTVESDVTSDGARRLRLRLAGAPGTLLAALHVASEVNVRAASLDGRPLPRRGGGVTLYVFGPRDNHLDLEVPAGQPVPVTLVEQRQVDLGLGRPPGTMAKPQMVLPPFHELANSDLILVTSTKSF
jgi:hypothetical protein